ncbi:hypothetical protein UY3_10692 [Chelonia mydas]|uniref:Uncharacterized protein n=1 Tax=Chelonia mydas TaxID=8469 RepID=M7B9C3_CHEMY|nr:hypothetical protein UY3_10692 [Chelonia mydas]
MGAEVTLAWLEVVAPDRVVPNTYLTLMGVCRPPLKGTRSQKGEKKVVRIQGRSRVILHLDAAAASYILGSLGAPPNSLISCKQELGKEEHLGPGTVSKHLGFWQFAQNCLFGIAQTTDDVAEWIIKDVRYTRNLESSVDPEPCLD